MNLPTLLADQHGNVLCSGCAVPDVREHRCDPRGCSCAPCFAERMLGNMRNLPNFAKVCDRYADAIQAPDLHGSSARVDQVRKWGLLEQREGPNELGLRVAAVALSLAAAKERKDCDQQPVVTEVDVSDPRFVMVDVEYSTKGYRALYQYRTRDHDFCLAQD